MPTLIDKAQVTITDGIKAGAGFDGPTVYFDGGEIKSLGRIEIGASYGIDFQGAAAAYQPFLRDLSNNEILDTQAVASAVNQLGLSNAATGDAPILEARGGDANIGINLLAKGTGAVRLDNGTDPVILQVLGAADGMNNEIQDVNGNEILGLQGVASAVNELTVTNAATTANPAIGAQGGDTNIGILLTPKGTGAVVVNNGTDPVVLQLMGAAGGMNNEIQDVNGNEILALQGVASAVNEFTATNAATGAYPTIAVQGGDANIGIVLDTKASGQIRLSLGGVGALRIDDAAITGFAAAADTAGLDVFIEAQSAGTAAADTSGTAGADVTITAGDGAAGGAHTANNPAGGDAGNLFLAAGAGGAAGSGGSGAAGDNGWVRVESGTTGASGQQALLENKGSNSLTTAGPETLTVAQFRAGVLLRDPNGGARTDTTPTAALLVGIVPGAKIGDTFMMVIVNTADAAENITLAAGNGVTLRGSAGQAFGQNTAKLLLVRFTNVTGASEAVDIIAQ